MSYSTKNIQFEKVIINLGALFIRAFRVLFLWMLTLNGIASGQNSQSTLGQNAPDQLNGHLTIGTLIDSISVKFNIDFAYDAEVMNTDSIVKVAIPEHLSSDWLQSIFGNDGVEVLIIDRQVIIGKRRGLIATKDVIRIKGRVEDFGTGFPLAMVNIGVEGKPVGTITNDAGYFEFLLPGNFKGEKLSFSYLGYLTRSVSVPASDSTFVISLPETSVRLPEVQVRVVSSTDIIRKTSAAIVDNYASEIYFLTAFFRETIQQDHRYVDVSEAVIEILKPSYLNSFDVERVRFIKGRKGRQVSEMNLINFKLEGGPYHFSRLDVVRNRDFLPDESGVSDYTYSYEGVDIEHGRMVYRIGFKPHSDTGELYYQGELRIDSESYAIVSAVFEMTGPSIRRSRNYLIRRDARRFRTRPFFARYKVDYRPWNDLWVLARVRGEVNLRIVDRNSRESSVFHTVSEMLVSDFTLAQSRRQIRWVETFRPDYILSDHLGDFDPEFWSEYNIIQPNESLEKVFAGE